MPPASYKVTSFEGRVPPRSQLTLFANCWCNDCEETPTLFRPASIPQHVLGVPSHSCCGHSLVGQHAAFTLSERRMFHHLSFPVYSTAVDIKNALYDTKAYVITCLPKVCIVNLATQVVLAEDTLASRRREGSTRLIVTYHMKLDALCLYLTSISA
jgi:hypothetical protein